MGTFIVGGIVYTETEKRENAAEAAAGAADAERTVLRNRKCKSL